MANDIKGASERLRAMMVRSENATRRAEVLEALQSKREGIQSCALQVLGAWGGAASKDTLRAHVIAAFRRKNGDALRGVAVHGIAPWITADDANWVLDLYFALPTVVSKHQLVQLVLKLPPESARAALTAGLSDKSPTNRHAAVKAIGNMLFPDRRALLLPLRDDPDKLVSSVARALTR